MSKSKSFASRMNSMGSLLRSGGHTSGGGANDKPVVDAIPVDKKEAQKGMMRDTT